jgi:tetratricopeptide (TPR) repeat protein
MAGRQFFLLSCLLLAFPFSAKADEKLIELVKKTKPAVVLIQTFDKDNKALGQGSGFFVNNKGHIVTNHHVLEGAYRATIKTSSGMEYPVEGVIAKNTDADIVKLHVNVPDASVNFLKLTPKVPSEGEDIVVIGNPLGLESTVSNGIVSAVRDIPTFGKILQITAPISPGSSGSPVVNMKGEVIGIATLVVTKGQNLNFAVPSDKILKLNETAKISLLKEYIVATDANDTHSLFEKGLKELWQANWSAALIYFQKVTVKNPEDANAWSEIAFCYYRLERYEEAIDAYKQSIRIKPNSCDASYLGKIYGKLGRWQEAIDAYKQSIQTEENRSMLDDIAESITHCYLGDAYGKLGQYQNAIEAYEQAIKLMPDNAEAHYNLGSAYYNLDRYQDAIESYKQAIRIEPDDASAHCSLGSAYYNLGHHQNAVEAYQQAIRIKLDYAEAHYGLGVAYHKLGRYQDAIESYKQAIKIKSDYANAHYNLGGTYLRVGDKGSALEEYKILKTLDTELANKLFNIIYK